MDKFPFFYYDILSRMIPGAVTLATLSMIRGKLPQWWCAFLGGQQSWKAVIIPLLIGGLCYVVGVFYEATDYFPGVKWIVLLADDKAFASAWATANKLRKERREWLRKKSAQEVRRFKFEIWDRLVFIGGREAGMSAVLAHCHRFQAEHKMFLHLVYPTFLFAAFSVVGGMWTRVCVSLFLIVPTFSYFSHSRNTRRWLQTLSFCEQLKLLENCTCDY